MAANAADHLTGIRSKIEISGVSGIETDIFRSVTPTIFCLQISIDADVTRARICRNCAWSFQPVARRRRLLEGPDNLIQNRRFLLSRMSLIFTIPHHTM